MINWFDGKELWYLVGLITTDGCLSTDGRHVNITSKNKTFLELIKGRLYITNNVTAKYNGQGDKAYNIQISDKRFYNFLISVNLFPKKSLTISAIKVPDIFFDNFLRGVIDGDGNIQRWIHPTNRREQWVLRISSGSKQFALWLLSEIEGKMQVKGKMHTCARKNTKNPLYLLKFGKVAAKRILYTCYLESNNSKLHLERKYSLALDCIDSPNGWKKSKTIAA